MAEIYLLRHDQASFDAKDYDALSPLREQQSAHLEAAGDDKRLLSYR